ncbi:MAG TPA: hypothetical protein VGJ51_07925 [Candidatus Angelobacter sp.]
MLRAKMATMQEEADAHAVVLTMGRDPALMTALNELYDQPQLAQAMAANPADYLSQKGVKVPPGASLNVQSKGGDSTVVEAHFDQGANKYKVTWDRNAGFTLTPKS